MTDINTNCDYDALQDAIVAAIQAKFPDFRTVEFERDERRPVAGPACLLEMSEFEPHETYADAGTGQLCVDMTFEARLVLGFREVSAKRAIRKLSTAFAAWIHLRRWKPLPTGPCRFVSAYPDSFSPDLDQYEVWRITWTQTVFLGDTVWKPVDMSGFTFWLQPHVNGVKDGDEIPLGVE